MKFLILLLVVAFSASFLPYRHHSQTLSLRLQEKYVAALVRHEGETYAPYGEEGGISCSTLVRQSLIDVLDKNSKFDFAANPCSSEELKKGCNGELSTILHAADLKRIDYSKLQQGDIAIIGDNLGIHTMAYIGNEMWIHSDPIEGKVIETNERETNDDWTKYQVTVMRWKILQNN